MTAGRGRTTAGIPWAYAVGRGAFAFVAVAGVAIVASLASFVLLDPGYGLGTALRIGALYLGPFHHIPVVIEGRLDLGAFRLPDLPPSGSTTIEIGVALLAVTALAMWLLFGAGRTVAGRSGGGLGERMLAGAAVAPGYAVPVFLVALLVHIERSVTFGSFASGTIRFGLGTWQGLAFPLVIAATSGAAGGAISWLEAERERRRIRLISAALAGGWRMFGLGLLLAYGGLLVAGAVQSDAAVALLTPSTARYYDEVFDRPGRGTAILVHHLALAPNEAVWTLVPATGACDQVAGGPNLDVLCYGRFPHGLEDALLPLVNGVPVPPGRGLDLGRAPPGYFVFLLVPAVATVMGGRRAARRAGLGGRDAMSLGAAAGVPFAALILAACLLSSVTIRYGSALVSGSGGTLWLGPDVFGGAALALMWGVAGGAIGAATVRGDLR